MFDESKKQSVLIVDDMPTNIRILSETIQNDYEVLFARSGQKALELAEFNLPDLVLLDIMMPDMDGYEVCRRLKSDEKTKDIPVVFITALHEEDDEKRGFDLGAIDYITKPFRSAIVKARVRTHLELKLHRDRLEQVIKECKLAEDEIRRLNNQLEERVIKRTAELKDAQDEIISKEHKSELADITTGTLHNVKNILNSVKVSSEAIGKILSGSAIAGLKNANEVLRNNINNIGEFFSNDPKGQKLIEFYFKIEEVFGIEAEESRSQMRRLLKHLDSIEKVITTQQAYGGLDSLSEELDPLKIIQDALTMHMGSIKGYDIQIKKDFSDVPKIKVQKIKLMHILVNLIRNAKEAMLKNTAENRVLTVSTSADDDWVYIKINDTGHGIAPEDSEKMFTHGFTTKKDGHGYGLYSCKGYMEEMAGEIWAESQGEGRGATFVLKFPASN